MPENKGKNAGKKGTSRPARGPHRPRRKFRVTDLANKYHLSAQALVGMLQELGYDVRSPQAPVSREMERAVRQKIEETRREEKKHLERKKRIYGEGRKGEGPRPRYRRRFDREKIEDKVKETLSKIEAGRRIRRRPSRERTTAVEEEAPETTRKVLKIPGPLSVQELAKMMGLEPVDIIQKALEMGMMVTINQTLDQDTLTLIADEFGYDVEVVGEEVEEEVTEEGTEWVSRPPVVTVMGHVDHGKTSLLDYIRKTNVAAREPGGITQHIGAYQAEHQGKLITFIDTPGHEAFTALRARGAQVTDIVVLVVAANEGVKPQTVEAINHARAAGVPIIVAINKIDLPDADPERVKQQLTEHHLVPEEWGGDTMMIPVSAKTGEGVEDLLDAILVKAEEMDLKAPIDVPARGVILESKLDRGKGPVATVIVQQGILRVGTPIVAGTTAGKVRAMYNEFGKQVKEAGPSTPVLVQGLDDIPHAGDVFHEVETIEEARRIAEAKKEIKKEQINRAATALTIRRIQEKLQKGELKELPIVLKADTQGSMEAISDAISRMVYEEVRAHIIHQGVGAVKESDVLLASASDGVILAFNVGVEAKARETAKSEGVLIKSYKVIYELLDDVKKMLSGLLEPEIREVQLGTAEVREIFKISRVGTVAGCYVLSGVISRDANVRVRRDGQVVFEGKIASLRRYKEDVREVQQGYECGVRLDGFDDVKVGDIIEVYRLEEVRKTLE